MRPPEIDVTFALYELACKTTEDDETDEPYMWILGFKVDADTLGPAAPGSLVPSLGVKVIEGMPAFPNLGKIDAGEANGIPAALGTRSFRLKPALLPLAGWFPGIAGLVSLLWDQDNFDPGTAEAGHKKFNQLFGPALSTELNNLLSGGYDDPLSRDANGNVTPAPAGGPTVVWRLARLRDAGGRKNAVKAITSAVKDAIINRIKDAIIDEAGLDELFDPDDLLGVDAQVFLGDELSSTRNFALSYTDDDADYSVKGYATSYRVNVAKLDSTVLKADRVFDRDKGLWLQVCWFGTKLYWATAYKIQTTIRFEIRALVGAAPTSIRWFVDDTPIAEGQGSIPVNFESVDIYEGPPEDALAPFYPAGPGVLTYNAAGPILDISNASGTGVFYGKVRAVYAYAGDPSLFPPPPPRPVGELLDLGYSQEAELGIHSVDLEMNDEYRTDISRCKRIASEIDRKHIAVYLGKRIDPGDPPPFRQAVLDRVKSSGALANALGLAIEPEQISVPLRKKNIKGS